MNGTQFLNRYQPQTLQNATILLYINAVLALLSVGALFANNLFVTLAVLAPLLGGPAGYGIANDKKWGYQLGLVSAIGKLALIVFAVVIDRSLGGVGGIISILFAIVSVVLLTHQQSKDYVKLWFK